MKRVLLVLISSLCLCACTSTGYKLSGTDRAAAVGAAVGAGLGAIIGSQAGDPLSGIALGSVAGGSIGAMIGNQFDRQDEKLVSQSEIIENQQQEIEAHKSRIEELQHQSRQQVRFQSEDIKIKSNNDYAYMPSEPASHANNTEIVKKAEQVEYVAASPVAPKFENLVEQESKAAYDWKSAAKKVERADNICAEGDEEVALAAKQTDSAEKLYHLRRALRICPENAEYHNAIGEIYVSLDRTDDARFEFNEALRINPRHQKALENLSKISG